MANEEARIVFDAPTGVPIDAADVWELVDSRDVSGHRYDTELMGAGGPNGRGDNRSRLGIIPHSSYESLDNPPSLR